MAISMRATFRRPDAPSGPLSLRHSLMNHLDGLSKSLRAAHRDFLRLHAGSGFDCGCRTPDSIELTFAGVITLKEMGGILPAWVSVDARDPRKPTRQLEGVLLKTRITSTDFPLKPWHSFYDWNFFVEVDDQYLYLLNESTRRHHSGSLLGKGGEIRNIIECEWDSAHVPLWAIPQAGSRVTIIGRWIYDCGHPPEVKVRLPAGPTVTVYTVRNLQELQSSGGVVAEGDPSMLGKHRLEIHPPRGIVSLRSEAAKFEGNSGPTRAMNAVVYLGHDGGYIRQKLEDQDYLFDLPLPPRPHVDAAPLFAVTMIEGNLPVSPQVTPFPPRDPRMMRVVIPLKDAKPLSPQYGFVIAAGWSDVTGAETARVRRVRVTIQKIVREDPPLPGTQSHFRRMVLFVGVNGRWCRHDVVEKESAIDFVIDLALHEQDHVHITACGFVATNVFKLIGKESGVPHAHTSEDTSNDQAKNSAKKVADAFPALEAPFLKDSNDPIVLFAKRHRPMDARPEPFKASAADHVAAFEPNGASRINYILHYSLQDWATAGLRT